MLTVNLFDRAFAHSFTEDGFDTASAGVKPKLINWSRGNMHFDGITVFTDHFIFSQFPDRVKSKVKIAWIIESEAVHPWAFQNITKVEDKFDHIFTYKKELLERSPKYKRMITGSLRVPEKDRNIWPKSKMLSIIASNKNTAPGHKLRHSVIKRYGEKMDVWGSGYKKFNSKLEPLKDYRFSIAIMNVRDYNYFTEILSDCLALGTVPIFWGCPNISDFFNVKGILTFTTVVELGEILQNLSEDFYNSMMDSIKDNFERVQEYSSTDDMMARELQKLC